MPNNVKKGVARDAAGDVAGNFSIRVFIAIGIGLVIFLVIGLLVWNNVFPSFSFLIAFVLWLIISTWLLKPVRNSCH